MKVKEKKKYKWCDDPLRFIYDLDNILPCKVM